MCKQLRTAPLIALKRAKIEQRGFTIITRFAQGCLAAPFRIVTMSENLFELELAIIEDVHLHKTKDKDVPKRQQTQRKLAARRAVESHHERQRLREELGDVLLELPYTS